MPPMLTCAYPSFTPPTFHPQHLLHKNCITTNDIRTLKAFHAREIHARNNPTLLFFNLSLRLYVRAGLMHEAHKLFDKMPQRTLVAWTILMSGYTQHGPVVETLKLFEKMVQISTNTLSVDCFVFAVVLRACALTGDLNSGRQIHCQILKTHVGIDSFVDNALITMYGNCGFIKDSISVFNGIQKHDLVSWSSMMSCYAQNGQEEEVLRLFVMMIRAGIRPDVSAFSIATGASANLSCVEFGAQIHCCTIKMGFDSCMFLANSLIDFYAECGDCDASIRVFNEMPERNLISWNTILAGHVRNRLNHEALRIFRLLMIEFSKCDEFALTGILQAVTGLRALDHGREIHGYVIRIGLESNIYAISALLDMYIECIHHENSCHYDDIPLKLFNHIQEFDEFIIASLLKSCALRSDLKTGVMLHACIVKLELKADPYVISSLIDMYSKSGLIEAALRVFTRIKDPGTVTWSTIIAGHCRNGWFEEALQLFQRMYLDCVEANQFTYTSVILACISLGDLKRGKELHCNILRSGYGSNVPVISALINLYSELGSLQQSLKLCSLIPENEVSWDALFRACVRIKDHKMTLNLFQRVQRSGGQLDQISACCALNSCANPVLSNAGTQAQAYIIKRGLTSEPQMSNSLINMYSGSGMISSAVEAFDRMPNKNSDSWTSIISANVDHGQPSKALELFMHMCRKNKSPDSNTFIFVLKACADTGLVYEAFRLFAKMSENYCIEPSVEHYSCMVEVLGRAGMFYEAEEFINNVIPFEPGGLIWGALLSSCRIHGNLRFAKYAAEKLLELEPSDCTANLLLEQVLLTEGKWDNALTVNGRNKSARESSSRIEIRNRIYEFVSDQIITEEVSAKLVEMRRNMEELGYVADKIHWLHNAEEGYGGMGFHHTEIMALAFGLVWLPQGTPIRIIKSVRMCGRCHSTCKFMSTFIGRDMVIKDSCTFHHFRDGKCSCRDAW
ncbi:pentatricopeptide repeat-containing protein At4g13650-like [Tasmannia lanceolata]|uniref:pentatricopeptide repeat-containing protein At4g13650-like n=1 Tax=Tasmannia lanceolata TaxID=3420 RepID=UPI0040635E7D